jgi:hypothetical protein
MTYAQPNAGLMLVKLWGALQRSEITARGLEPFDVDKLWGDTEAWMRDRGEDLDGMIRDAAARIEAWPDVVEAPGEYPEPL